MKRLKNLVTALAFAVFAAAPITVVATPVATQAACVPTPQTPECCESRALLGLPVWFRGLSAVDSNGNCVVTSPADVTGGLTAFIWKIALNIIEMGMIIAGYVALFFILYGGFLFLTNGSNPSVVEKARTTIINSTIGLAIALGSIGILNLIFRVLG